MSTIVYYKPHLDTPARTGALRLDSIQLLPTPKGGVPVANHLSESSLAKLKAHPSFERRTQSGAVSFPATPEAPQTTESSDIDYSSLDDLSSFNIEGDADNVGAQDIVAQTTDLDLLDRWLQAETRKTLQAIIESRIEELA